MSKVALVTGITGQDGSYLAEMLLEQNFTVFGIIRFASTFNTERIDHIFSHPNLKLRHGDITDAACLIHIFEEIKAILNSKLDSTPDSGESSKSSSLTNDDTRLYVFNLAAQSHVKVSFEVPLYTAQVDAIGTLNVLEAIRATGLTKVARFYQASTSELYGLVQEVPQSEKTPFYPRSPYGVAKLYAYWIVKNYREAYGMYACNGVLFNHESERRGKTFVTRKITRAVARIHSKRQDVLMLGNLDAKRDWGYAPDYCRAMVKMLEQPHNPEEGVEAKDYVIGSGEYHSVREFVEEAFKCAKIDIGWRGTGLEEVGYDVNTNKVLVKIDPKYFRPAEVEELLSDPMRAKAELGWEGTIPFKELVNKMVQNDLNIEYYSDVC